MGESLISFEHTEDQEDSPRRFWSLRMRKKINDETVANYADKYASEHEYSGWKSWKRRSRGGKDRKKSRLSIWKSWFLALIKPKSKGMQESDMVHLSGMPTMDIPFNVVNDAIMETWHKDVVNNLVMAITLPEGISSEDIKVDIVLKVVLQPKHQHALDMNKVLRLMKQTERGPVYFGTVRLPTRTNILQVSQMPFYLMNGGLFDRERRKIETIIKPADNILPEKYDKRSIVHEINLRVHFETDSLFNLSQLSYEFFSDLTPIVGPANLSQVHVQESQITFDVEQATESSLNTIDLIDQITSEAESTDANSATAKNLVKEILNQVVSKISLTSSDFIEDFHKELELQKSLLLETTSSILPCHDSLLSKISETDQEDTASTSKTSVSSKKFVQNVTTVMTSITNPSDWRVIEKADSTKDLHVPTNTPDVMIRTVQAQKITLKEDVKADIDRTLELLETAKNKLLRYLNHAPGHLQPLDQCAAVSPISPGQDIPELVGNVEIITVKVEPFKNFEDLQFFPESIKIAEEDKPPDIKVADPPIDETKDDDDSDSKDYSTSEEKPLTNPVHELNQMLLEEFHKQTGIDVTGKEQFDLDDLAQAAIFLDEEKVEDMTDAYISDEDFYLIDEYNPFSLNDEVFEDRFAEEDYLSDFALERVDDDIAIMLRELTEQSNMIKEMYQTRERNRKIVQDVKYIVEDLLQRVEREVMHSNRKRLALMPLLPQINRVYFCLTEDYVDGFMTAERAGMWLANRLRIMTDAECKSTISVRRILSNGEKELTSRFMDISIADSLLQNLEKGVTYLSELYKEIFSRNLNFLQLAPFNAMASNNDKQLPLVRKSNKIIDFEKKAKQESSRERESFVEEVQKVITPDDKSKQKMNAKFDIIAGDADKQKTEISRWPYWKREWIKFFTRQHANDELEGFRQLNDLVRIRSTGDNTKLYNSFKSACNRTIMPICLKMHRNSRRKNSRMKLFDVKKGESDGNLVERPSKDFRSGETENMLLQDKAKEVGLGQEDDDDLNKKVAKKKLSKELNSPPVFSTNDMAIPSTSTANDADLLVLHYDDSKVFESTEQLFPTRNEDDEDDDEHTLHHITDVPRAFPTSSMKNTYINNLNVLQNKLNTESMMTLRSTSSSSDENSLLIPRVLPHTTQGTKNSNSSIHSPLSNSVKSKEHAGSVSSSQVSSSGYLADVETYQLGTSRIKTKFVSKMEINAPEEISKIEENIHKNEYLNPPMKSLSITKTSRLVEENTSMELMSSTSSLSLTSTEPK